jgi:tetratricopeptide (TPR) repeat protein
MATGRLNEAAAELESLRMIAADKSMEEVALFSPNNAASVLAIAAEALAGELAAKRGYYDKAVAHLHRAVLLQDALVYIEPPDWHYPVRQSLGAVLLEAGRPVEAEVVYWEDLKRTPENGWSLYGLMKALQAQGKTEQAEAVEKRFQKAWSRSDVKLTTAKTAKTVDRGRPVRVGRCRNEERVRVAIEQMARRNSKTENREAFLEKQRGRSRYCGEDNRGPYSGSGLFSLGRPRPCSITSFVFNESGKTPPPPSDTPNILRIRSWSAGRVTGGRAPVKAAAC